MSVSLGTFIRERRQELGLSQEELAERIGNTVRQSEVSRLEHDRVSLPRRDRLEAIAAGLDVSIGALLMRTGWIGETDVPDRFTADIQAATRQFRTPENLDAIELQNLAALLDSVAAVRDMVTEAGIALDQAQGTITSLMRALNVECNTRGIIRPKTGLMDDWETTAVPFAI